MKAYMISPINETIQIENIIYCLLTQKAYKAKSLTLKELNTLPNIDISDNSWESALQAKEKLINKISN
jgi:hypothetical protein